MKKKIKQPKKKQKVLREKIFSVKLTTSEYTELKKRANAEGHGMVGRVIRDALFG